MSPVYEFRCPQCKGEVELRFTMGEILVVYCEECHEPMERLISKPATPVVKDGTPDFHGRGSK